jgi:phage baseplate assembly protein W
VDYFKDINYFSPTKKPLVTNAEVIRQELALLFNTRPGERLFEPDYGIGLENYLFDLISQGSADELFFDIINKVKQFVSTVSIDQSNSEVVPDPENNRYILNLVFNIKGASDEGSYQMTKTFNRR